MPVLISGFGHLGCATLMTNFEPNAAASSSDSGQGAVASHVTNPGTEIAGEEHGAHGTVFREYEPQFSSSERILALIDQVIGLQAELAEERYRHDRELEGLELRAAELEESLKEAKKQAADLAERLEEVLASHSWRLGQAFLRPVHRIKSRLIRP